MLAAVFSCGSGEMAELNRFEVAIIDSYRGEYLLHPDIEQEVLEPYATAVLHRVHTADELVGRIENAHAIITWHLIPLRADFIARLRKCRGIVCASVGYDKVDISYAAQRGIAVCNVPDYGTEEVADHAMALILALVRRIRILDRHAREGGWEWRTIGSVLRLRGSNLGVVGFGRIGSAVARRAQSFGLNIGFYDPYVPSGIEKAHGVTRYESLRELLDNSDIVSLHVPLTGETRHLIGGAEMERLTKQKILINTSRGEVIDQQALIQSVLRDDIGGVGLDVLSEEPHVPDELRASDKVLLTAHSAFYADASLTELRYKAAMSARRFLLGQAERNIVNGVSSIKPQPMKTL
jgi:C-terminal binding protein